MEETLTLRAISDTSVGRLTLASAAGDGQCAFAAYVVDPPGFETVPLPSGSFTCALGRAIRV